MIPISNSLAKDWAIPPKIEAVERDIVTHFKFQVFHLCVLLQSVIF